MYPFEIDDDDDELETEEEGNDVEEIDEEPPMEFGVNFETGQLTGGKVTGAKAVLVWAWNALMYPRYRYELTSWNYGCELQDLIGQVMDQEELEMTVDAIIRDTLLPNEYILDIDGLTCDLNEDRLTISFTIETPFGEEELNNVTLR